MISHARKQESMTHTLEKSQQQKLPVEQPDVKLNKVFQVAIINMFKELKGTTIKELKLYDEHVVANRGYQ